jgi:hypothetical protein
MAPKAHNYEGELPLKPPRCKHFAVDFFDNREKSSQCHKTTRAFRGKSVRLRALYPRGFCYEISYSFVFDGLWRYRFRSPGV